MKSKLIIGALVAVIVIAGIWYYLKSKKEAPAANNTQAGPGQPNSGNTLSDLLKPASSPLLTGPSSSPTIFKSPTIEKVTLVPSSPQAPVYPEKKGSATNVVTPKTAQTTPVVEKKASWTDALPTRTPSPQPAPAVQKGTLLSTVQKTSSPTFGAASPTASPDSQATLTKILRAKNWRNGNNTWTGEYLKITILPDGSVTIGSGYRGKVVDYSTIITNQRNGQPSGELTWKAV